VGSSVPLVCRCRTSIYDDRLNELRLNRIRLSKTRMRRCIDEFRSLKGFDHFDPRARAWASAGILFRGGNYLGGLRLKLMARELTKLP